jgi:Noc2p family
MTRAHERIFPCKEACNGSEPEMYSNGEGEEARGRISDLCHYIVAVKEKRGDEEEAEKRKQELFSTFVREIPQYKREFESSLLEIKELIKKHQEAGERADRERIVKLLLLKKVEVLAESLVFLEKARKREYSGRNRELVRFKSAADEYVVDLIRAITSLLTISSVNKYFFFKIQLIRLLNMVSAVFDLFVPVSFYVLKIVGIYAEAKCSSVLLKPIPEDAYKVSDKYVFTNIYRDEVVARALDVLVTHLKINSTSVSFPEFSGFIVSDLKRIRNASPGFPKEIRERIDSVIKCVRAHSDYVTGIRRHASISDEEQIRIIERNINMLEIE